MMKLVTNKIDLGAWIHSSTSPKFHKLYILLILLVLSVNTAAICIFPAALQNANYTSSNFGLLQFEITNLTYAEDGVTTWTCYLSSGNTYVIQSDQTIASFSAQANFYYCLELTQQTDFSFSYYLLSTLDNTKRRKTFPNTTTVTMAMVCDDTLHAAEFNVMVNLAAPSSARTYCATPLLGNFQYTFNDQFDGTEKCGTAPGSGLLDVCTNLTRNTLTFNYTGCSQQVGFSTDGVLYCVAYTVGTSGSTTTYYQSLFNADNPATTQFTCLAISSGTDVNGTSLVYVSQTPNSCSSTQNSTTAPDSSGDTLVLTATETCPFDEEEAGPNIGLIVGLTILGVVLLAVTGLLLFYCCYWKKRDPNAGKPIVENTKPRFEDPDEADVVDDIIDMEDNASTIVTREDIAIEAGSPSFLPNGKPLGIPNGTLVGSQNKGSYVMFNGGLQNGSVRRDSGIAMTERSSERPIPRVGLNASKEAMVIFNGDEKVISGNDSRIIPAENPNARTFRLMDTSGDSGGGLLSLQGLEEDEEGDYLGDLSPRDFSYPSLPREKSNLMPPIETVDPEKNSGD